LGYMVVGWFMHGHRLRGAEGRHKVNFSTTLEESPVDN
jgi:hypothetical protein